MIIGKNKEKVIENIKQATISGKYNIKVEIDDPNLTSKQKEEIVEKYIKNKDTISYKIKNKIARVAISIFTDILNKQTEIVGIENLTNINTGAIITSNHFNPLDNLIIQKLAKKMRKKRLYIVGQESNLAMEGFVGFFMNYSDIIPITNQISYMKKYFHKIIKDTLKQNNYILIYPEQEMWFNYKKPRPLKEGAYYYAAKNNVPIISCFVEMLELQEKDNEEFNKVKYILHILPTIYPDIQKTPKQNSIIMMEQDYKQKKEAYEKVYGKKLNYEFEIEDIAGWNKNEKVVQ